MFLNYETTLRRQRKNVTLEADGEKLDCVYMECLYPASREEYEAMTPEEKSRHLPIAPLEHREYDIADGILCEQDAPIVLRDGVTVYADIYRPKSVGRFPAILAWSPYGKRPFYTNPDLKTMGVPKKAISPYTKEEGPDPLYWCRHGYAIVNVDPRGLGHSEGDVPFLGTQEARDGYDVIEALAVMPWCSGRIGMAGNSYLAMSQWIIAATQPPHLACIAPWEGTADLYRELFFEGGIPSPSFPGAIVSCTAGEGYREDIVAMAERHTDLNSPYWRDKIARFENITCPAYICAGWSHMHLRGTMNAWRKIASEDKWLRAHRDFEWPDFYDSEHIEDLRRFFDRYLRGIPNGWELTPRVRLQVMDVWDLDYQTNRPELDFPIPRTKYERLFLNAAKRSLDGEPPESESDISYDANTGVVCFDHVFSEETELTGYMKLKLWVEARGHDDMDLFVNIQKLDADGKWAPTQVFDQPHPGAWGKLRVSRRRLDEELSTDFDPVYSFTDSQKLAPGEIVPVEIEIVPTSRIWHEGQALRVQISGHYIREDWFEPLAWETDNSGEHVLHTGGGYDSWLQIPVVPPRFTDGRTVIR